MYTKIEKPIKPNEAIDITRGHLRQASLKRGTVRFLNVLCFIPTLGGSTWCPDRIVESGEKIDPEKNEFGCCCPQVRPLTYLESRALDSLNRELDSFEFKSKSCCDSFDEADNKLIDEQVDKVLEALKRYYKSFKKDSTHAKAITRAFNEITQMKNLNNGFKPNYESLQAQDYNASAPPQYQDMRIKK